MASVWISVLAAGTVRQKRLTKKETKMPRAKKKKETFTVTITKRIITPDTLIAGETSVINQEKIFEQTVEKLDLKALINAINNPSK